MALYFGLLEVVLFFFPFSNLFSYTSHFVLCIPHNCDVYLILKRSITDYSLSKTSIVSAPIQGVFTINRLSVILGCDGMCVFS